MALAVLLTGSDSVDDMPVTNSQTRCPPESPEFLSVASFTAISGQLADSDDRPGSAGPRFSASMRTALQQRSPSSHPQTEGCAVLRS